MGHARRGSLERSSRRHSPGDAPRLRAGDATRDAVGDRLTFTVGILAMLAPFSIDTYLPSLPDIARDLVAADWQVQQTLSLYLLAFAATTLIYGPLSDALGRRAVVIGSLALYAAASLGCVLASNINWLLAMRIGQGLSASGPIVVSRAMLRDAFSGARAQRAMSKAMVLFSTAPAVAPIVGGYLQTAYGWRSVFWFLSALALLLWAWTAWTLPETLPPADRRPAHPRSLGIAYGRALVHGQFMLLVSSAALCFSGLFLYVAGSPTLLYRCLGYRPDQFWYLFLPIVAGFIVGAQISSRLAGRHSHSYAVNVGFAMMLSAAAVQLLASLLLTPRSWSAFPLVTAYAAGMAVTTPNMVLIALDCLPERRGLASAIQSCIQIAFAGIVAGALVPFLSPQLWTFALASLALSAASIGLWTLHSGRAGAIDEAAASVGDSRSTA